VAAVRRRARAAGGGARSSRARRSAPCWLATGGDEIVDDLHNVAADNAFGIPQALPAGTKFAVKNGWTAHSATGKWYVDC